MRKHGGTPSRRDKHVTPAANRPPSVARGRFVAGQQSGLAGVSRLPSSRAEPLPVWHRGDASGNHGAPLHDRVHLPTYLRSVLHVEAGLVPPSQTQFICVCFTGGMVRVNWCSSSCLRRLWIFLPKLKRTLITQSTNCTSARSGGDSPTSSTYTLCTQTEHSFRPSPDRETRSGVSVRPQSLSSAVFSCPFTGGSLGPETRSSTTPSSVCV